MPGISLHLLNLTNVTSDCPFKSTSDLLDMLDAPHNGTAWPATAGMHPLPANLKARKRKDAFVEKGTEGEIKKAIPDGPKLSGWWIRSTAFPNS
jgi:dihydroxyacetone kinase